MPIIDNRIIEALRRQQLVTEYIIYPFSNITNYQIKLTSVPSYSKEDVLVISNKKILSHWVELKGSVWIKIPTLVKNTPLKIYTLTGNPSATSASNGTNTFEFFEDASRSGINTSKWTQNTEYATISGGVLSYDPPSNIETYLLHSIATFPPNSILEITGTITGDTQAVGFASGANLGTDRAFFYKGAGDKYVLTMKSGTQSADSAQGYTISVPITYKVVWTPTNVSYYYNNVKTPASITNITYIPTVNMWVIIYSSDPVLNITKVIVRKYIAIEPIVKKVRTLNKSLLLKELMR